LKGNSKKPLSAANQEKERVRNEEYAKWLAQAAERSAAGKPMFEHSNNE